MNEDIITVAGHAGGDAVLKTVNGTALAEFRLGTTSRRRLDDGSWADKHTNWYTVEVWGDWAPRIAQGVRKGDDLVVQGELRVEDWESGDRRGTSVKLRPYRIAHDMRWRATTQAPKLQASTTTDAPAPQPTGAGPQAAESWSERAPATGEVPEPVGAAAWTAPGESTPF